MASSSQHGLSFIVEATRGTTPATPTMTPVINTSCSIQASKSTYESEAIRTSRQIRDFRHGAISVGGDFGFELAYGSHDALLEACLCGAWNTNVLKAGTTRRYFTFERLFGDILTGGKPYHRFRGCELTGMSLTVQNGITGKPIVTGTFTVMGKDYALDTAIISGETYSAETTTKAFDSFTGTINEGGIASAIISEVSFTLSNGQEAQGVIGSKYSTTPIIKKSRLTGSVTAQFDDATLLEKFLNETASSLDFTLTDAAGNDLTFDFPNISYTGGEYPASGENAVLLTLPFQAIYSTGDASQIVVTRAPAA